MIVAILCLAAMAVAQDKDARFFDKQVVPILRKRCLGCHNEELKNGNVSVLDRASLLKGGPRGPAIVPGDPERSVLIKAIRHDGEVKMPPGPKLSPRDVKTLTEWVRRGAQWGTMPAVR